MRYICDREEDTARLAAQIAAERPKLVALIGDLAMGKTFWTRAFAKALGIREPIVSPTFSLVREYATPLNFHHWDLYRVEDAQELFYVGFDEYLERADVTVIEWPECVLEDLEDPLILRFYFEDGHRIIEVSDDFCA